MKQAGASRRISVLREEVSRKIAAGEVIDRPLSIVRELLDNALDAGSASVDVHLARGGLDLVRVVDDGAGMDRDDLSRCWLPHATSKIETEEDLLEVTSLGFRGEALSSMATASRLEIVSCPPEGVAHRLVVRGGKQELLEPCQGRRGTVVDVSELFFNYPARKRFLRSPSAEAGLSRSVFLDRAAAFPGVAFRLFADGALRLSLPATDHVQRISLCHDLDSRLLGTAEVRGEGFTVRLVAASPDGRRTDRRLVQAFVNNRRVQEFSLVQAVEFGFQGYLPGGYHPVAFVFVDIDPSLVDFNIHPAKKEVRFRTLPEVHRAVVSATRMFLAGRASVPVARDEPAGPRGSDGRQDPLPLSFERRSSRPLDCLPAAGASPAARTRGRYRHPVPRTGLRGLHRLRARRPAPAARPARGPRAAHLRAAPGAAHPGAGPPVPAGLRRIGRRGRAARRTRRGPGGDGHRGAEVGNPHLGSDRSLARTLTASGGRARGCPEAGLRRGDRVEGCRAAHGCVPARAQGGRPGGRRDGRGARQERAGAQSPALPARQTAVARDQPGTPVPARRPASYQEPGGLSPARTSPQR